MKKLFLLLILAGFIATPSFAVKLITNDYSDRIVPSRSSQYDNIYSIDEYYYSNQKNGNNADNDKTSKFTKYQYDGQVGWLYDKVRSNVVGGRWLYPGSVVEEEVINQNKNKSKVEIEGKLPKDIEEINILKKRYNSREAADYYTVDIKNRGNGKQEAIKTPSSGMIIEEVY